MKLETTEIVIGLLAIATAVIGAVKMMLLVGADKRARDAGAGVNIVTAQDSIIENYRQAVLDLRAEVASTRTELADLRAGLAAVTLERDELLRQNADLRDRVDGLERQVKLLTAR